MSESEPTVISRWMSRAFHVSLISVLLVVVGFRIYDYFATSATELGQEHDRVADQNLKQLRDSANKAYSTHEWELAATSLGRIAQLDPGNVRNRIRLAYALHAAGHHDPALAEFLFLCRFDGNVRRWALYNAACIYAIKGEKRLALDYLGDAVLEGYRAKEPINDDPDFRCLQDDDEFQRLAELVKPFSQRDLYHRFDFLIGQWDLTGDNDQQLGAMTVTRCADGYTLQGSYGDDSISLKMTFFAYVDPSIGNWRHVWVDDQENVIQLHGAPAEHDSLVLLGSRVSVQSRQVPARAIYTEGEEGMVHLELATSIDEGVTWHNLLDATLVPSKQRDNVDAT